MEKTEKIEKFSQLRKLLNDMLSANRENKLSEDIPETIIFLLGWYSKNFPGNKKEIAKKVTKFLEYVKGSKYNSVFETTSKDLPHLNF